MKYSMIKLIFTLLMICSGIVLNVTIVSASDTLSVRVKAKYMSDGEVRLRWAPKNYLSWRQGLIKGYKIEAYQIEKDGTKLNIDEINNSKIIIAEHVIVEDTLNWKGFVDKATTKYVGLAAGTMFGENFTTTITDTSSVLKFKQLQTDKENRFGMAMLAAELDYETATYSGLAYTVDKSILSEKSLYYIVVSFSDPDTNLVYKKGICSMETEYKENFKPRLKYVGGVEKVMRVIWEGAKSDYLSYEIYRSGNNESFTKVSSLPILGGSINLDNPDFAQFADTVELNKQNYYYTVRGLNSFGEFGPWSDTLAGKTKPGPFKVPPVLDSVKVINNTSINIFWSFPSEYTSQIKGYNILRAEKYNGSYVKLNSDTLSVNTNIYSDLGPEASNYYKVEAIDIEGYKIESFSVLGQLIDSIPPAKPATPAGTINKKGNVSLHWNANTESDLQGYKVYMANSDTNTYTQITSLVIVKPLYNYDMDIKNLNKHTYLKIRAIDKVGNQSAFSNSLELDIPDIIAPASPNIVRAYNVHGINKIEWEGSPSTDVYKYIIKRREKGTINWDLIKYYTVSSHVFIHSDSTAQKNIQYEYTIGAADQAGNIGFSPIRSILTESSPKETVDDLIAAQNPGDPGISISWGYNVTAELSGFKIFRAKDGYPYQQYVIVKAQDVSQINIEELINNGGGEITLLYHDINVTKTHTYKYKAVAIYKNAMQSELSNESSITVN